MRTIRNKPSVIVSGIFVGLVALAIGGGRESAAAIASEDAKLSPEQHAVKKVIENSYFNGAFNKLDTEAMAKGFHKDFAIFSANGDELGRYEIATWIKGVQKRKMNPEFDPKSAQMDCRVVAVDVTGGAAAAKIEIRREGRLVYTDYLSLLKFKSGWKISAKVYHKHPSS